MKTETNLHSTRVRSTATAFYLLTYQLS